MRKKKKIYADAYECDEGSPVVVEIQYDKGEAMLCFGRDGMAEYTLRAGSAGDILHVLVNAEKQLNRLMDDEDIPLPLFPEPIKILNGKAKSTRGKGKKEQS